MSRKKSTARVKVKAASQEERIHLWKQHFKNLLGKSSKVNEPIVKIISNPLDIKLGQFTQEELDIVLRKIKNRKATGLDEIPPEVWKTRKFDNILLRYCNAIYDQNIIDRWTKGYILPFSKEGNFGISKNYWGIILTFIVAKVYNTLLLNCIEPEIEKILMKNYNGFQRNRSMKSRISTICRILEGVCVKNFEVILLFVNFSKAFDSKQREKMEQILLAHSLLKETIAALMML